MGRGDVGGQVPTPPPPGLGSPGLRAKRPAREHSPSTPATPLLLALPIRLLGIMGDRSPLPATPGLQRGPAMAPHSPPASSPGGLQGQGRAGRTQCLWQRAPRGSISEETTQTQTGAEGRGPAGSGARGGREAGPVPHLKPGSPEWEAGRRSLTSWEESCLSPVCVSSQWKLGVEQAGREAASLVELTSSTVGQHPDTH